MNSIDCGMGNRGCGGAQIAVEREADEVDDADGVDNSSCQGEPFHVATYE